MVNYLFRVRCRLNHHKKQRTINHQGRQKCDIKENRALDNAIYAIYYKNMRSIPWFSLLIPSHADSGAAWGWWVVLVVLVLGAVFAAGAYMLRNGAEIKAWGFSWTRRELPSTPPATTTQPAPKPRAAKAKEAQAPTRTARSRSASKAKKPAQDTDTP